jgi:hypothetical protein
MNGKNLQSGSRVKLLYQQKQLPIFQNKMYQSEISAKNCLKGDIDLVEDLESGFVYNAAFDSELMTYDASYQNEQGVSPLFLQHLNRVIEIIFQYLGSSSLVEVGCGKGLLLEMLLKKGCDITGYDPTYEGDNEKIKKQYFLPGLGINASGLILRHVLEHIQDPFVFLTVLKNTNGGAGRIYIEVPCLDWICKHDAWFDIFYEHVNYFRISDFYRIFSSVISAGHLFGGQYIYVVADLSELRKPVIDEMNRVKFPESFGNSLDNKVQKCQNQITIWGGASKGVIFALYAQRAGYAVNAVIDINPKKQGLFLPATGIKVESPEAALQKLPHGSTILIMNSNYFEEIKAMSGGIFNYVGIDNE